MRLMERGYASEMSDTNTSGASEGASPKKKLPSSRLTSDKDLLKQELEDSIKVRTALLLYTCLVLGSEQGMQARINILVCVRACVCLHVCFGVCVCVHVCMHVYVYMNLLLCAHIL